jgi:hypothetical protein
MNVSNTGAAPGSHLLDLQVNDSSKLSVSPSGDLVVSGTVGVGGALTVGPSITVDNGSYGNVVITQFASVFGTASGPNPYSIMQVRSNDGTGMGMNAYGSILYSSGALNFHTGATVRDKDYPTGGTIGVTIASNGNLMVQSGAVSTSTTTGALVVTGGAGISGNAYVGGNVNVTGTIYLGPSLTTGFASPSNTVLNINTNGAYTTAVIGSSNIGVIKTKSTVVGSLPSAATVGEGSRAFVTDASVAASGNFGSIVAGGGSNKVPVYTDGTNWLIG